MRPSRAALMVGGVIAAGIAPRVPTLAQPLLEFHGFRQTWTAWTAVVFHERGIDLLRPQLPIFGPPFVVPSELPLFQALGALVMDAGVAPDLAMRLTGLASFALTAALLWRLVRDVADELTAFLALALFLVAPLGLVWSRTSMIEYLATAGAVAYCWAGLHWREERRWRWYAVALLAGTLGALVKPTTVVFWALPLFLHRAVPEGRGAFAWLRERLDPRAVLLAAGPFLAAVAWLAYGDSIKTQSPAASFLASSGPLWREYYYADLGLRLTPRYWQPILRSGMVLVGVGLLPLLPLAAPAIARARQWRWFWVGMVLAAIAPVLVFYGAYIRHDYYYAALAPQVAALCGLAAAWLVRLVPRRAWRAGAGAALVAAAAISLVSSRDYWGVIYEPVVDQEGVLAFAREVDAFTRPDELVVTLGRGYDPDMPYYARRRGLMLSYEFLSPAFVQGIPGGVYGALVSWDPWVDALWVGRHWTWIGARSPHVYALGAEAADLGGAPLLSTDDLAAYQAQARTGRELLRAPLTVPCDGSGTDVPAGATGTVLRLRPGYAAEARVGASVLVGPVPARALVELRPELAPGGRAHLTCAGTPALTIDSILDVAVPR